MATRARQHGDDGPGADPRLVSAALVTVQVLFGIHYLVSKWIVAELEPAAWACVRVASTAAILLPLCALGRRPLPRGRDLGFLVLCAFFGVAANQALFLEGISRTTVGHASLINSQIPTFALLAAVLSGQERLTGRKALSFALGAAGVLVLLEADTLRPDARYLAGDLLHLGNSVSYGVFIVMSRRAMRRHDPLAAVTVVFAAGALMMLPWGGDEALAAAWGGLSTRAWWGMAFAVLGATVGTYFLNLWALKRTHATRVALYIFLQPLVATALGVALLGDALTPRFLAAAALVFGALAVNRR